MGKQDNSHFLGYVFVSPEADFLSPILVRSITLKALKIF